MVGRYRVAPCQCGAWNTYRPWLGEARPGQCARCDLSLNG